MTKIYTITVPCMAITMHDLMYLPGSCVFFLKSLWYHLEASLGAANVNNECTMAKNSSIAGHVTSCITLMYTH